MATFTIENDKSVRRHLATLESAMGAKFAVSAYQGDYVNTITNTTFGDRVQSGCQRTFDGIRYLFVLNVFVIRNSGGRIAVRVSAWSSVGRDNALAGSWPVRRTALCADKRAPSNGVFVTGDGFSRRISGKSVAIDANGVATRAFPFMESAIERIRASVQSDQVSPGYPVQLIHGYSPRNIKFGESYDTAESHLLVFGGETQARARLAR